MLYRLICALWLNIRIPLCCIGLFVHCGVISGYRYVEGGEIETSAILANNGLVNY